MNEEEAALMPLKMWLDKQCTGALAEIKIMWKRIHNLSDTNTAIIKQQIKQQKKIRILEKKVKELEGKV